MSPERAIKRRLRYRIDSWYCRGLLLMAVVLGWSAGSGATGIEDYLASLQSWKLAREAALKSDTGYLNLAGLYWLKAQETRFGSDAANDIVFPENAPPIVGTFLLAADHVMLTVSEGVTVLHAGAPVTRIRMSDDTTADPVIVTHGSLAWTVIQRDGNFAIRLRDFEHPALRNFAPIDYYPADPAMNVRAVLDAYPQPRQVRVDTVIEGLDYRPMSPGLLRFRLGGNEFALEAYRAGENLLLVFGDQTTGRDTYPAGRFLYTGLPDGDGVTWLDFNKAENPPCAFNEFATCPVASPRNRLKTLIEAGERYDPSRH